MLRASMNPCMVSVIPNAVDANVFTPDITKKITGKSELYKFNLLVLDSIIMVIEHFE